MHGGILSNHTLITIPQADLIIAAYSHQLYLFSIQEATITEKVAMHEHRIIDLFYKQESRVGYSIDEEGCVCSFRLEGHKISEQLQKYRVVKKGQIKEAKFRNSRQAEIEIITLNFEGNLVRHVAQFQYLISKDIQNILLVNDDYIGVTTSSNSLQIISSKTLQKLYKYTHLCAVTSLQQYENNLIIGDENGKITILVDFLRNGQVKLKQKLQWHVHQVNTLKVNGSYLYSAGEEGVIVLWHLRENKKDFLPRIGSRIINLQIQSSKIYCFLGDNTIKSIDLNNDKSVLHYKVIINPQGDILSDKSSGLIKNNLIRVSNRCDKLYLRSFSGRIQQIDLYNGINTEHNILNRNFVSRLDSHLPTPHQITDICFSEDNSHIAIAIQGINCRIIKFYENQNNTFKLVSKVQNCHSGTGTLHFCAISNNRFLSYTQDDTNIKIWKLSTRKKESMLQIQEYFWCCQYSIQFRSQQPLFVNARHNRLIITYQKQFVIFNMDNKAIESVYSFGNNDGIVAVLQKNINNQQQYIAIFQHAVELVTTFNNTITHTKRLVSLNKQLKIDSQSIVFNHQTFALALLCKAQQKAQLFIVHPNQKVTHLQIPNMKGVTITDIFWIKQRLIALDSSLYFYDLTHEKELIHIQHKSKLQQDIFQTNGQDQTQFLTYDTVYQRYLQRQFKKDQNTVSQNNQILTISPSISTSFQMLANQLFL